ncbi:MAG: hypothetical protein Q8S13_01030 [Dehalococcoidia bacterium]|nr:hypothetical protein [Dehalococcoidia bacterium]
MSPLKMPKIPSVIDTAAIHREVLRTLAANTRALERTAAKAERVVRALPSRRVASPRTVPAPSPTTPDEHLLLAYSPFRGVMQLVGEPGVDGAWATLCWDGTEVVRVETLTIVPLSVESAFLLSAGRR